MKSIDPRDILKAMSEDNCPTCKGTGNIAEGNRRCPDCNGTGAMKTDSEKPVAKGGPGSGPHKGAPKMSAPENRPGDPHPGRLSTPAEAAAATPHAPTDRRIGLHQDKASAHDKKARSATRPEVRSAHQSAAEAHREAARQGERARLAAVAAQAGGSKNFAEEKRNEFNRAAEKAHMASENANKY